MKDINSRALLVNLSISTWTARKYDRKITRDVNNQYGAAADAGRYNKHLLAGSATSSYSHLMSLVQKIRLEHYFRSLPWADEGWRLIASDQYMRYMDWYRKAHSRFELAKTDFLADYPIVRGHQSVSNPFFQAADYPTVDEVAHKFGMSIASKPIEMGGDIRLNLNADAITEIQQSMQDRINIGIEAGIKDAWTRLYNVTEHIALQCSDPSKKIFTSLIGNAKELCSVLVDLNVTGDAGLEAMRAEVASKLSSLDVDDLREDDAKRKDTADKANEILKKMSEVYGIKG